MGSHSPGEGLGFGTQRSPSKIQKHNGSSEREDFPTGWLPGNPSISSTLLPITCNGRRIAEKGQCADIDFHNVLGHTHTYTTRHTVT